MVASRTQRTPINLSKVGDEVLAFAEWLDKGEQNNRNARLSYEKITDIFTSHQEQTLVHLTLDNGDILTATEHHPFKTPDGWRDTVLLKKGGQLLLKDGTTTTITDVKTEQRVLPVYNLEVANAHTYFVGVGGELVHNAIDPNLKGVPGIYKFKCQGGKDYIGKAKDLYKRLRQHERSKKLPPNTTPRTTQMPGSTNDMRRAAEQQEMNLAGGSKSMGGSLENEINSVKPSDWSSMGIK